MMIPKKRHSSGTFSFYSLAYGAATNGDRKGQGRGKTGVSNFNGWRLGRCGRSLLKAIPEDHSLVPGQSNIEYGYSS